MTRSKESMHTFKRFEWPESKVCDTLETTPTFHCYMAYHCILCSWRWNFPVRFTSPRSIWGRCPFQVRGIGRSLSSCHWPSWFWLFLVAPRLTGRGRSHGWRDPRRYWWIRDRDWSNDSLCPWILPFEKLKVNPTWISIATSCIDFEPLVVPSGKVT